MNKSQAAQRIEKLRKEIDYHRYQYHVLDTQEISDAALDSLKHELATLEEAFPDLITASSPTQRVAGKPLDKFQKIQHMHRMLSLQDVFNKNELEEWEARIQKMLPDEKLEYYCELKIDGLALSLIYENGILQTAATRGDGFVGEDVTQNIKTIQSIPLEIPYTNRLEVRGEVYMTKKSFEKVNKQREKDGESLYANPRNLAAGSIRQLDPQVTASRELSFFAYDIRDYNMQSHADVHVFLKEQGFRVEKHSSACASLAEVYSFCEQWVEKRNDMPYLVDGVVIAVDNQDVYKKLGVVGKAPRWAVAYKFPAEQATSIVEDIQVQVGRTGAITPVAHLTPTLVAGTTVSRATLHNIDEIERLDVRVGDTVIIEKAGDIIPDIVEVLTNLRPRNTQKFEMPKNCPICESELNRKHGEVAFYCSNKKCFAQQREQISHFISKKGFNIDGLGPRIVEQLLDQGLISSAADLFELQKGDLLELEGFAEKSADNLLQELERRKEIDSAKFIYSLGIRYIGQETAFLLKDFVAQKGGIKTVIQLFEFLHAQSIENFQAIEGIGEKVAQSLYDYFHEEETQEMFQKFDKLGVKLLQPKHKKNEFFADKSFLMTGSFSDMKRDEVYEIIRNGGGQIQSSVSKNLDYLLVGDKAGSKLKKAQEFGVEVLSEEDFKKHI